MFSQSDVHSMLIYTKSGWTNGETKPSMFGAKVWNGSTSKTRSMLTSLWLKRCSTDWKRWTAIVASVYWNLRVSWRTDRIGNEVFVINENYVTKLYDNNIKWQFSVACDRYSVASIFVLRKTCFVYFMLLVVLVIYRIIAHMNRYFN